MVEAHRVNVALIGAGNFARRQHLPNLSRIRECRLRAICDADRSVLDAVASAHPSDYTCEDARRVFDDPAVQAVVIAVRHDLQPELAIAALRSGKHVYVEKPLGHGPGDCARVAEAARQADRRLAVGFNRRYAPIYRRLREVIASAGGCFNVHVRMADDAWRWANNYPPGFLLPLDAGHLFDLLRWLCGAEIEQVACLSSRAEDDAMLLRMDNGCVATIQLSGNASMDLPKEQVDVITQRGAAMALDFVELRTFGLQDQPAVETFPGHSHPQGEYLPVPLLAKRGLAGLLDVRRCAWELRQLVESGGHRDRPDAAEIERFVAGTTPNFLRDQGWLASLRAFVIGVRDDTPTDHANAMDAWHAARATRAAVLSRQGGQLVCPRDADDR